MDTVTVVLNRPSPHYWLGGMGSSSIVAVLVSALSLLLAAIIVFIQPRDAIARFGALVLAGMSVFALWYGRGMPGESWDLWALAVAAYEILNGTHPFAAEGAGDWSRAILAGRMIPPCDQLQGAPASWDDFFGRALASDIKLRPSSAAQFAVEFQSILI